MFITAGNLNSETNYSLSSIRINCKAVRFFNLGMATSLREGKL